MKADWFIQFKPNLLVYFTLIIIIYFNIKINDIIAEYITSHEV